MSATEITNTVSLVNNSLRYAASPSTHRPDPAAMSIQAVREAGWLM